MNALVGRTLKGATKSILVEADALTISYRALFHGFKGDKRIPFSSITAVQFMEPRGWIAGYLQLSIKGAMEWHGPPNQDENAIQYEKCDVDDFRALARYINERITVNSSQPIQSSTADEIAKLAILRAQGVLSGDEFTAQKIKLLSA